MAKSHSDLVKQGKKFLAAEKKLAKIKDIKKLEKSAKALQKLTKDFSKDAKELDKG